MLRSVLEDYFNNITEREFDAPFISILQLQGFFDINFLHGSYEYGKDFIAKRKEDNNEVVQYKFQSKAGDINVNEWRKIQGQIEEMRYNPLSHPSYDDTLKQKNILVTTGRLVGQAATTAQQYKINCLTRTGDNFDVWDQDFLINMISNVDILSINITDSHTYFLSLLSKVKNGSVEFKDIENYSNYWLHENNSFNEKKISKLLMESSLITHELLKTNRYTLAGYASLLPVRVILYSIYNDDDKVKASELYFTLSKGIFNHIVQKIINIVSNNSHRYPIDYEHFTSFVQQPILSFQIIELVGLYGLDEYINGDIKNAEKVADFLSRFIESNLPTFTPFSDKYAVSLIPSSLLLKKFKQDEITKTLLKEVMVKVLDIYEIRPYGLSTSYSTAQEEVFEYMGYSEKVLNTSKRGSYISTTILDLCYLFGYYELYEDICNDILAVSIRPITIEYKDNKEQFLLSHNNLKTLMLSYVEKVGEVSLDKPSSHYNLTNDFSVRNNLIWEHISTWSILKDRHSIMIIRSFLQG